MVSTSEIRTHINSIKKTQKITNAMYLIASTKLQRAKRELENTQPYFDMLRDEIKRVFRHTNGIRSPYFYLDDKDTDESATYGIIVITADKGLAGMYNDNIIKETNRLLGEHQKSILYLVGENGRSYYEQKIVNIAHTFRYSAENPTIKRARQITETVLQAYDKREISKLFIVYSDLQKGRIVARSSRMIPFHQNNFLNEAKATHSNEKYFEFSPNPEEILHVLMHSYLNGYIYSSLVSSFCCEQKARMEAMDTANDNAEELLTNLQKQFNMARQAAITQEITEISAGALAQRKLHERK